MLYAVAKKEFTNQVVTFADWPAVKEEQPLKQLPTLKTEGQVLCQSNVIARHVARRLGLVGEGCWDETWNDLVLEVTKDFYEAVIDKIYTWKLFKSKPEPEDVSKVMEEVKGQIVKNLNYIQSIADKKGKKFIVGNDIQLGDVWLYAALESCKLGVPDIMTITPWVKEFTAKFEADERMKKHMADRAPSSVGI
ncbi:hypothetical protein EB796_006341 [Bugula neritina]|uniref:HPGDS n=1 Tax=Bugula neritina TaxID=10212 RepID=A0A7J7KAW1_BUGNE|nr:hypothetical protein EB796_006341 [Bugula neritina]